MSFETIVTDREIGQMKTRLRALERKRDTLAIHVAKTLNLPNIWTLDMVDWNNPEVASIKPEIDTLDNQINELSWEIDRQESLQDGNIDYFNAKVKAHDFIQQNFTNFDDEAEFYQKNNLVRGMSSLTQEILENPDYLEEVVL